MTKLKRSLSALLAVVMVITTMSIAFTVAVSAAPTVPRTATTRLSPIVTLAVPAYLETYGGDFFQGGSNVKAIGRVQVTVTPVSTAAVENIAISCSDAGVSLSPRDLLSENEAVWTIMGGTLKNAPLDDGTTVVKWTATYTVGGKGYVSYAWSQVQPRRNNPGFAVFVRHQYTLPVIGTKTALETHNRHIEWIQPAFGDPATDSASHITQCYIDEGLGKQVEVSGAQYATSYYWYWDKGNGCDNETDTAPVTAKGTIYADVSQTPTLSDVGMSAHAKRHKELDDPSNRPQTYHGVSITSQSVNGSTTTQFSVSSSGSTSMGEETEINDAFSGALPAANSTATIKARIEWEGQVERGLTHPNISYQITRCDYTINIVTYDKTALWAAINTATNANYQASHFRNTSPGSSYVNFRTWDQYIAALQNAWYIYGRKDVEQTDIDDAVDALNAAMPVYNASTGRWVSGMMYADADYSSINDLINMIPETLDPDFYEDYSDGTHGKYYQFTLAMALNDALEDIDYDDPLDARYQGTVDQMRVNLNNAINALKETEDRQTTKMVGIEFVANQTNVSNMPAVAKTRLTGRFLQPTATPTRQYYRFLYWSYDPEGTDRVTWPIYINANNSHFKADLDAKVDDAGIAYTVYAQWQVTGKTLTFDTQGGSAMEPVVGEEGMAYAGPTETPTKSGCRFMGWYADANLNTPVDWNTFTFGSLNVVYAKWAPDSFTVTFYANGGTFTGGALTYDVTDLYGALVVAPLPPTKSGVGFDGWYYDSNLTQQVDISTFTIPDHDVQVYAKWNSAVRNIIFNPMNGTSPIVVTGSVSTHVEAPEQPERAGYTFNGWFTNPSGTGIAQDTSNLTIGRMNITLYAGWTGLPFTVTFDPGEGASMAESFNPAAYENKPCGTALTAPEDPIKPEYVFTGWTLNNEPYTLTTVPAENITLVASWEEEPYTAQFRLRTDVVNGTVEQGDVITATVSLQANRVVANHRFIVYYDTRYLQPALNGKPVTTNITGPSACSKIPTKPAYFMTTRNHVTDCGTQTGRITPGNISPALQNFPADWVVDNTTLKEEYRYYEFVYFDVADIASGTRTRPETEQDLASFQFIVRSDAPLADGVTNYAQLLLSPDFTRTPERTQQRTIAACLQADTEYTNNKDWNNTTNVVVDGDHRFAVEQMHACRINFITNGGVTLDPIEDAKQGGTVALPTPTRDYYNFSGWTLTNDADDTEYVNASAFAVPYQDSLTLYAKWTGKTVDYYIRHHKQKVDADDFMENFETQKLRGTVGTTVTATLKNYDGFICQNPSESGVVRGETSNPLYLDLWYLRKTTNITLDANGGKFRNGQQTMVLSGKFDATVSGVPDNPTRDGYDFDGWQLESSNYVFNKYPANDITVTAKWTTKTITIRFFLNGSETPYGTLVGQYGASTTQNGDPFTAPTVAVNDGYVFSGWKNADGTLFSYTTFPANDEDFFGSEDLDGYLLTLYINGNPYGNPREVRNGTEVTEAYIGYTPDPGYRFTGWRTENSVDGALAVFPMTLSADTTLYGFTARETYSIQTIIYDEGEPTDGPSVTGLFYGQGFDLPEPDDYSDWGIGFRGWYTDPDLTIPYVKPATMPAQNLLLYGEYYEMTGTIEFDLNGGSGTKPANITKSVGTTVTLPAGTGITRRYYTFGGWSTSPTGTTAITKYTINTEGTVKIYAIWNINYATVNFNLNGAESGTVPASIPQVEVGTTITAANLPSGEDFVKTGFIFTGWSDDPNATTALKSYKPTSVGTKTLYAVWIADTVTLVAKDGSAAVIDDERGFIYGLAFELTENDVRNDYLSVIGNGHLEFSNSNIGTGTYVYVINDYSGNIDATYQIVIFGDLTGDGIFNGNDITFIRNVNAHLIEFAPDTIEYFAADVTHDGIVNANDVKDIRSAYAHLTEMSQTF